MKKCNTPASMGSYWPHFKIWSILDFGMWIIPYWWSENIFNINIKHKTQIKYSENCKKMSICNFLALPILVHQCLHGVNMTPGEVVPPVAPTLLIFYFSSVGEKGPKSVFGFFSVFSFKIWNIFQGICRKGMGSLREKITEWNKKFPSWFLFFLIRIFSKFVFS